ncbi:beta-1,3-galactosyltransferase 1-like [Haliotis rubra]|uniref:beta-1,3-galactosyltransferase 1-like n=1 Tax=Haliotis rubra TaxID=36100 RepID=UPI001EE59414|nr:beta-1,3-galactosyltransferase 1-like [Haliotis rubra]
MTWNTMITMRLKHVVYFICLITTVMSFNIWYAFLKNNHTTRKYPTHVRFVSINSRRFQNAYSSEDDHVLSEPENESQHTGAVGLSQNIVTDVLRKSHPVITEELTKTHPINSTELIKSHPINSEELTQSHPINSAELTQSHPINSAELTKSHPINSADLTQSHPINSTDLTKSHSMIAEVLTKKHISANGWHVRPHTCTNCFRHDFVYLIQNEDICSETNKNALDLIILIMTRHNNIYRRNVIRATWAAISRNNTGNVRYVFLLGEVPRYELMENVKLEALHYKDMLMEDFRDSYHNLTYKTIMGLKWASSFCDNAKFVLKTDDDMWVNVPEILQLVNRNQLFLQSGVLGRCGLGQPIRDKRSRWYITYNEYPLPYYKQYCSGSGYVTSMAVAKRIYNISRHVPFLKFEDAYFGLCIEALGNVRVRNQGKFFYMGDFRKDICFYKSEFVLTCHSVPVPLFKKVMQAEC